VYRSLSVWHLGLIYVAFGFSYIIYMTFFTKYLITKGGYTPQAAGPGVAGVIADAAGSFAPAFILAGCVRVFIMRKLKCAC